MENSRNEEKLDALLSKAQDPNRIKTAREFMADKNSELTEDSSGPYSQEIGEDTAYEITAEDECCDESCDCKSESTSSSI